MLFQQQLNEARKCAATGNFSRAKRICDAIIKQSPNHPGVAHLSAMMALQQRQWQEAIPGLALLHQLRPHDEQILANLALAQKRSNAHEDALHSYRKLVQLQPDRPDLIAWLADTLIQCDEIDEAEHTLRQALVNAPDQLELNATLAQLLEQKNQDHEALKHADKVLAQDSRHFIANYVKATVLYKIKDYQGAEQHLDLLRADQTLPPVNRSLVLSRLGQLLDKTSDYAKAFEAYEEANQLLSTQLVTSQGYYTQQWVQSMAGFFTTNELSQWQAGRFAASESTHSLVFLVGFPRSGTTLMDRMLNAHSQVRVLEERPMLQALLDQYANDLAGLERLKNASEEELVHARLGYFEQLNEWSLPSSCLIVDKLPLNVLYLPLIYRLFPEAKVIFAIRDPRDVVLSCFFQSFSLNEGMKHFLTLQNSADYYIQVMTLGLRYAENLPLRLTKLVYEQLITNAEEAVFWGYSGSQRCLNII